MLGDQTGRMDKIKKKKEKKVKLREKKKNSV
jgi:hypothetical protein